MCCIYNLHRKDTADSYLMIALFPCLTCIRTNAYFSLLIYSSATQEKKGEVYRWWIKIAKMKLKICKKVRRHWRFIYILSFNDTIKENYNLVQHEADWMNAFSCCFKDEVLQQRQTERWWNDGSKRWNLRRLRIITLSINDLSLP